MGDAVINGLREFMFGRESQQVHCILAATLLLLGGCSSTRPTLTQSDRSLNSEPEPQVSLTQPKTTVPSASIPEEIELTEHQESSPPGELVTAAPLVPPSVPESEEPSELSLGGMTLAEIEALALGNNPSIREVSASASKAAGYRDQVGTSPNPKLVYFSIQLADRGTDQHAVHLEQEIVRGNKLALNRRVLSRQTRALMFDLDSQRQRVLTDVRLSFYDALAAQRQIELTNEFYQVAQKVVETVESRKQALEASQIDLLQSQIQLKEIELTRERSEYQFRETWRELAAIAGMPYLEPARLKHEFSAAAESMDWEATYQMLLVSSPERAAAHERIRAARALLERQKAQPIPNLTIQFGGGLDEATNSGMVNVQAEAPLPFYNRNSGNISAAYAEYCRATHEARRIELKIQADLARVARQYDSAQAAVLKYQQEILPRLRETWELSEQAYDVGEQNFLQLLIVRKTDFESNLRYVQALKNLAQAKARIDGLLLAGSLQAPNDRSGDDSLRGQTFSGQ